MSSNGRVVPRPSEIFVPSKSTVPEYTIAVSSVGMFGDGITHGKPVSSKCIGRFQPSIATTVRSAPMPHASLKNRASSPMVMPWRTGTEPSPTNDSVSGATSPPSTSTPPSPR